MTTELVLRARHQGGLRVLAATDRHSVPTDYPLKAGQDTAGMTSLELLLAALATCSANGLMLVLQRRMGLPVTGLEVEVRAQRRQEHPTVLTHIALHFRIQGPVFDEEAVAKAIHTAETQLCPVWVMVGAGTPIETTFALEESLNLS
jgi:putative redox protein